jgi:hypothetical protein
MPSSRDFLKLAVATALMLFAAAAHSPYAHSLVTVGPSVGLVK